MNLKDLERGFWPIGGLIYVMVALFFIGCVPLAKYTTPPVQEIKLTIQGADTVKIKESDAVHKTMEVRNPAGQLSNFTFIAGNKAYMMIFSALTTYDVKNLWQDICVLENSPIRELHVFINSPGGDAFSGLGLADQIESAKKKGFTIIGHASGIIASAALPVFAVCTKRLATAGTIFMVHETSIWKWPGSETASDIRAQNELMDLIRDRYFNKLIENSKLSREDLSRLEKRITWFSSEQAKEWGLIDEII